MLIGMEEDPHSRIWACGGSARAKVTGGNISAKFAPTKNDGFVASFQSG